MDVSKPRFVRTVLLIFGSGLWAVSLGALPLWHWHRGLRTHGKQVFQESGCSHCHGTEAHGTERGPDLAGSYKRLGREGVEKQIRNGGKQMPPFGDSLRDDDLRALLDYLRQVK